MTGRAARLNSVAIFVGIAGFIALESTAMALYPGGTWWDANASGHRFWENFLCDLERRVALNGQPNPLGGRLAVAALLVLDGALGAFWLRVADILRTRPGLARAVRISGLASVFGTVGVILMSSERFGVLHGLAVNLAGFPGLAAAALAVVGLARSEPRPRIAAAAGAAVFVFALIDLVSYSWSLLSRTDGTPMVAAAEKLALGALLSWMVVVAGKGRRESR
jgi:hypothetical protein